EGGELKVGQHAVDEAHGKRLVGPELAGAEEDVLGVRRADGIDVALEPRVPVSQPELRGGQRKLRSGRAEPQIAADREVEPAAEAVSLDLGEGRLREGGDGRVNAFGGGVVSEHGFPGGALVLELGDVGAGYEGLPAGAGEDHHPDPGVGGEVQK